MGSEEELEQAAITSGLSADSPDLQLNVLKTGVATRPEKRVPDEEVCCWILPILSGATYSPYRPTNAG